MGPSFSRCTGTDWCRGAYFIVDDAGRPTGQGGRRNVGATGWGSGRRNRDDHELTFLKGRHRLSEYEVFSLISYEKPVVTVDAPSFGSRPDLKPVVATTPQAAQSPRGDVPFPPRGE